MGYASAKTLGPLCISFNHHNLEIVAVKSAEQMYQVCKKYFAVFIAKLAEHRPAEIAEQKFKKSEDSFTITMVKNIDIAYEFGLVKQEHQLSIGFALETNDE